MLKWFKNFLSIAIIVFLLWYIFKHWEEIKPLLQLNGLKISLLYFISLMGAINNAIVMMAILRPMGIKTKFGDMVMLQNACLLLNYVPMKFGTLFMANYLKKHYGLKYAQFGTFALYLTLLLSAGASMTGAIVMISVYGVNNIQKQILTTVFIAAMIISLSFIFIPLPVPKGVNKLSIILRDFLNGRKMVAKDGKSISIALFFLIFNFILVAVRLAIIYYGMGIKVHPAGFLVLGAIGYIMVFINITPGALGIREAVLGAGATILGVSFEAGVTAALIERAITLSLAFIVGGACTAWLWHKSPTDFKKQNSE